MLFRFKQENCLSVSGYVCMFVSFCLQSTQRKGLFFQSSNQVQNIEEPRLMIVPVLTVTVSFSC